MSPRRCRGHSFKIERSMDGVRMLPIPKKYLVPSGKAVSKISDLNAFDEALLNAGIGEQNLVSVSSILPIGIQQVKRRGAPPGGVPPPRLPPQRGGGGGE